MNRTSAPGLVFVAPALALMSAMSTGGCAVAAGQTPIDDAGIEASRTEEGSVTVRGDGATADDRTNQAEGAGQAQAAEAGPPVRDAAVPDVSAPSDGAARADVAGDGAVATGLRVNGVCYPVCGFPTITDPNATGFGWERQMSCLDSRSPLAAMATPCVAPSFPNPPPPGNGVYSAGASGVGTCYPLCTSSLTAMNPDGGPSDYGYERGQSCVVAGTAAALGGLSCAPGSTVYPPSNGVNPGTGCIPLCSNPVVSAPDGGAFGFENNTSCVVSTSTPALQGIPCTAPNPPPPPPPPPAPPGTGWSSDYTATMFGQINCAPLGVTDSTNLNNSTCVGRRAVTLDATNDTFYGATSDLSTLWTGAPCTCVGGQSQTGVCSSPPACTGQADCGQCVEIVCNGTGKYSFMSDGFTHDEFCKPNTSVVVEIIDACPHNHPSNTYWCTAARPNHIDLSCSAFGSLTQGRPIAQIGSINAYVRPVSCSVGLGVKTF